MQDCGLGSADFQRYLEGCALPHQIEVQVDLLTNDGDLILSFDQGRAGGRNVVVMDGQVDVDADTLVGRTLSLSVADPDRQLIVAQDANYTDRMLRVQVGVHVASLGQVVWAPVFKGPIVSAPRGGDVVQFTAQGKARFAQHGIYPTFTVPKGTPKTSAIKRILNQLAGEPYANMGGIPDLPNVVLKDDLTVNLADRPWAICRNLANDMERHLCYDGGGQVRMQRTDLDNPVYTFTAAGSQPGVATAAPISQTDWTGIKNAVRVTGGATPPKQPPVAYAFADPSDPFSAQTLGRDGAPAYYWDFAQIDTVKTQATAQRIANNMLQRDLVANREIKWESLPMYVFDEYDRVAVETPYFSGHVNLKQFSIPLSIDGAPTMSYGYNKRVSADRFAGKR